MARPDLEEWADELLAGRWGLSKRRTFGCPSYYVGRKMFVFLWEDGLGVKCDPRIVEERSAAEPEACSVFRPGDGLMRNWLIIVRPEAADYDAEVPFLEERLSELGH